MKLPPSSMFYGALMKGNAPAFFPNDEAVK